MAMSDFRLLASASLVGAFSLISPAHALDIDARINYTAPLSKKLAAAADDDMMHAAAGGIMTEMEAAMKSGLTGVTTVLFTGSEDKKTVKGKWLLAAAVSPAENAPIFVCAAGAGPGQETYNPNNTVAFLKIDSKGTVTEEAINGKNCSVLIKEARAFLNADLAAKANGGKIGESSSEGRLKQNSPE